MVPLSQVHSAWKGQLIPPALEKLQSAIESENNRLAGAPYIENGSDYDSKYFQFEVLRLTQFETTAAVGPEQFDYLQAEEEWVSYLLHKKNNAIKE